MSSVPSLAASLLLACLALTSSAAPAVRRAAGSAYSPVYTTCPSSPLVRQATGISPEEARYVAERYGKASEALREWLHSVDGGFECGWGGPPQPEWWQGWHEKRDSWQGGHDGWHGWHGRRAPVIALTSSGGGYRAMLTGAGVIKGLDGREADKTGVSGVYQALTYEAGRKPSFLPRFSCAC